MIASTQIGCVMLRGVGVLYSAVHTTSTRFVDYVLPTPYLVQNQTKRKPRETTIKEKDGEIQYEEKFFTNDNEIASDEGEQY